MLSNHCILCCPLLLPSVFPSLKVFSNQSSLCTRWPKYWSFSFINSAANEYSGLISFSIDWFDLFAVQGTFKSLFQHHSSKASVLRCSDFFMLQLSYSCMGNPMERGAWQGTGHRFAKSQTRLKQLSIHASSLPYMTTGKTTALTTRTFAGKVMSLLFNMLSKLVIAFLPRSKRLLISWLQSLSTVILQPKKMKSVTVSIV